jgi:hypothetical protein
MYPKLAITVPTDPIVVKRSGVIQPGIRWQRRLSNARSGFAKMFV